MGMADHNDARDAVSLWGCGEVRRCVMFTRTCVLLGSWDMRDVSGWFNNEMGWVFDGLRFVGMYLLFSSFGNFVNSNSKGFSLVIRINCKPNIFYENEQRLIYE